jgi:hypothetical protein
MRDRRLRRCRHVAPIGEGDEVVHVGRHCFRRPRDIERASREKPLPPIRFCTVRSSPAAEDSGGSSCMSAACAEVIAVRRMGAFGPTVAIIACSAVVAAAMSTGRGVRADAVLCAGVVVDVGLDLLDLR